LKILVLIICRLDYIILTKMLINQLMKKRDKKIKMRIKIIKRTKKKKKKKKRRKRKKMMRMMKITKKKNKKRIL
jgi:hypothetical protein